MSTPNTTSCPAVESLIAHLTASVEGAYGTPPAGDSGAGLTTSERAAIDDHLRACDRCVETLAVAHERLRIASEIPAALPVAVRERAEAVIRAPLPSAWSAAWSWISTQLQGLLRLPVLIPVAVSAGVLLVVATQTWMAPSSPPESTRAVRLPQRVRVTAHEAVVRAQPSLRAEALATLAHGDVVDVGDEDRDWYRITAPNGVGGWVERRAFQ